MSYYVDETMGLLLLSSMLRAFRDIEYPLQDDFLEQISRVEEICTCDIFMVIKRDKKWLDTGWNVDRINEVLKELRREILEKAIPLFLPSGNMERMDLLPYATRLLSNLEIFTKNCVLDNFSTKYPN